MADISKTYFDWASAAPVSKAAHKAFVKSLEVFGNPSSPHAEGEMARILLEDARKRIATLAGTKPDSIIFTSGATEANNLAIQGYVQALHAEGREFSDMHLIYMPTSHSSVVETVKKLGALGVRTEPLILKDGAIDIEKLAVQIQKDTVLVCMDVICGETGINWHPRDVRRIIDAAQKKLLKDGTSTSFIALHVDASQAPFVESFEHTHLGVDLLTLDAQKVGGVRGVGVLIRPKATLPLVSIVHGGGQEFGLRPGTENPSLAQAFTVALEEANASRKDFLAKAHEARTMFLEKLQGAFADLQINSGKEFAPHIINISLPSRDTDYLVMLLSKKGYAVSTKSACETNSQGSRTILALTNDSERALSTLRISFGPTSDLKSLSKLADEIIESVAFMDAHTLSAT
jgi:cysteine desulfurase